MFTVDLTSYFNPELLWFHGMLWSSLLYYFRICNVTIEILSVHICANFSKCNGQSYEYKCR